LVISLHYYSGNKSMLFINLLTKNILPETKGADTKPECENFN